MVTMLDPASAVGLAASIIQLTKFVTGILNDSHELYKSIDGALIRNVELETVCTRLDKMVENIKHGRKAGQGGSDLCEP
jgi:hypothetical protein